MTFPALDWSCYTPGHIGTADRDPEHCEPAAVHLAGRDDPPDCVVAWINERIAGDDADAYAALFAAAPELLAVLKEGCDGAIAKDDPDWWGKVYSVISKAEGKTP